MDHVERNTHMPRKLPTQSSKPQERQHERHDGNDDDDEGLLRQRRYFQLRTEGLCSVS